MSRDLSFDFIKGVLIILVVVGHVIQGLYGIDVPDVWENPLFNVIYTFHMPLFIFISGYFFYHSLKSPLSSLIKKKFLRLIVPSFVWSSLIFIIWWACYDDTRTLYKVYVIYKTYWYLICIFLLSVFFHFYMNYKWLRFVLIFCYALSIVYYDNIPWPILKDCQVIRQSLIFFLGILYMQNYNKINVLVKKKYCYIITVDSMAIFFVRFCWGINMMNYPPIIRIFDGITCSLFAFLLLKTIYMKCRNTSLCKGLIKCGEKSLSIYLIHVVLFKAWVYSRWDLDFHIIWVFILSLILMTFSYFMSLALAKLLRRKSYLLGV